MTDNLRTRTRTGSNGPFRSIPVLSGGSGDFRWIPVLLKKIYKTMNLISPHILAVLADGPDAGLATMQGLGNQGPLGFVRPKSLK
jgi:hypothetical protein